MSNKALAGVKTPVGLDLGKVAHRETAVGVLAELVKLSAGGELIRGVPPEWPEAAEAIDPVCGMTVDVGSARHNVDHEGATTTSAVPRCARAFEKDSTAFIGSGTKSWLRCSDPAF